jgi:hypothetical protein
LFGESSVISGVSPLAEKGAEPTFEPYHFEQPGQTRDGRHAVRFRPKTNAQPRRRGWTVTELLGREVMK